ncbi:MAG TPA: HRDC domain-containing protein [Enhygromyxa sp.]|nr:HRDC domain-containing protein [Enhygromyxa sp.]
MSELPDHIWVRDAAALAELGAALREASWVGLDSEANSMFAYRERVCLIQLNVGGVLWVLDGLALAGSLAPLAAPLADPQLRIWVHGGGNDVAGLKRDFGLSFANVFDTQQAASFLGWQRTGYAAVVEAICGARLAKEHTQYDWGQRPISDEALRYALDDVIHLPEIGAELHSLIRAADLEEELELANRSIEQVTASEHGFDLARMWKLKGATELRPDRAPVLAALYAWRDEKGRLLDYPPGRLIANEPLVYLAQRAPQDEQELKKIRLRGAFVREYGDELLEVIRKALAEPPEPPPKPKRKRSPAAEGARDKALRSWRREEAERRELPAHVILPPRALDWLAKHGAAQLDECPELGGKRIERYGATLLRLCAGA